MSSNATYCQFWMLVSPGNWLVCFYTVFLYLLFSLILLCWSVSRCLDGKNNKWKQMPWSLTAFSILACCDIFTTFSESRLWFSPFLLKPKHHLLSLVSNIHQGFVCLSLPILVNHCLLILEEGQNMHSFLFYIIFYCILSLFNIFLHLHISSSWMLYLPSCPI